MYKHALDFLEVVRCSELSFPMVRVSAALKYCAHGNFVLAEHVFVEEAKVYMALGTVYPYENSSSR